MPAPYLPRPNFRFSTSLYQYLGGTVADTTAYVNSVPPNVPCILIIDPKTAKEEKVKVTAKGSSSLTIQRGYGGTTVTDHNLGASVVDYTTNEYLTDLATVIEAEHNSDGTHDPTKVMTLTGTQSVINKTLTDPTNNVTARGLKSATTTVDVSPAAAPTVGQVLMATNATNATWQNLTLGYAQVNATQSGITTQVDLTGLSATVTVPTGARVLISAYTTAISTNAGDTVALEIMEGTTVLQEPLVYIGIANLDTVAHSLMVSSKPSLQ